MVSTFSRTCYILQAERQLFKLAKNTNAKKEDDKVVEDTPSEDKKDQSNEVKESVDFDAVIDNEMATLMMDLSDNF